MHTPVYTPQWWNDNGLILFRMVSWSLNKIQRTWRGFFCESNLTVDKILLVFRCLRSSSYLNGSKEGFTIRRIFSAYVIRAKNKTKNDGAQTRRLSENYGKGREAEDCFRKLFAKPRRPSKTPLIANVKCRRTTFFRRFRSRGISFALPSSVTRPAIEFDLLKTHIKHVCFFSQIFRAIRDISSLTLRFIDFPPSIIVHFPYVRYTGVFFSTDVIGSPEEINRYCVYDNSKKKVTTVLSCWHALD